MEQSCTVGLGYHVLYFLVNKEEEEQEEEEETEEELLCVFLQNMKLWKLSSRAGEGGGRMEDGG